MKSGIYCYENKVNGKAYVGQSHNVDFRIQIHNSRLSRGCDESTMLQYAVSKYGIENFKIYVLEYCKEEILDEREIFWISQKNSSTPNGYNMRHGGSNGKHAEATKAQISNSVMGNKNPYFGKRHSEKTKRAMRDGRMRGKKNKNSSSKYFGVWMVKLPKHTYWQAAIQVNSVRTRIGTFKDEVEAATKYDDYIIKNNIDAPLNFPERVQYA